MGSDLCLMSFWRSFHELIVSDSNGSWQDLGRSFGRAARATRVGITVSNYSGGKRPKAVLGRIRWCFFLVHTTIALLSQSLVAQDCQLSALCYGGGGRRMSP